MALYQTQYIHSIYRAYFKPDMLGRFSAYSLDASVLPGKEIVWLCKK